MSPVTLDLQQPRFATDVLTFVAFTGRLGTMSRSEAERQVCRAGGRPVRRVSRRTTALVIGMRGWPLLDHGGLTVNLQQAQRLNADGARIAIIPERRFVAMFDIRAAATSIKSHALADAAGLLGLHESVMRRWAMLGLIEPHDDRLDFQDLLSLRTIARLVAQGVSPSVLACSLSALSRLVPGVDRPLAQLRIIAGADATLLAEIGGALLDQRGQLAFDFEQQRSSFADDAWSHRLMPSADTHAAEEWHRRGWEHERDGFLVQAARAYERALECDASLAEAWFNLGNVRRALGKVASAIEAFRHAISHEPRFAEAWHNLADALDEQGRCAEAARCLQRAIDINPTFADAHFNLAECLERQGNAAQAAEHWLAYLRLDRSSSWASLARSALDRCRGLSHVPALPFADRLAPAF